MPYKSEAQRKFFNANKSRLTAAGVDVDEWNQSSKGKKLPKKVKAGSLRTWLATRTAQNPAQTNPQSSLGGMAANTRVKAATFDSLVARTFLQGVLTPPKAPLNPRSLLKEALADPPIELDNLASPPSQDSYQTPAAVQVKLAAYRKIGWLTGPTRGPALARLAAEKLAAASALLPHDMAAATPMTGLDAPTAPGTPNPIESGVGTTTPGQSLVGPPGTRNTPSTNPIGMFSGVGAAPGMGSTMGNAGLGVKNDSMGSSVKLCAWLKKRVEKRAEIPNPMPAVRGFFGSTLPQAVGMQQPKPLVRAKLSPQHVAAQLDLNSPQHEAVNSAILSAAQPAGWHPGIGAGYPNVSPAMARVRDALPVTKGTLPVPDSTYARRVLGKAGAHTPTGSSSRLEKLYARRPDLEHHPVYGRNGKLPVQQGVKAASAKQLPSERISEVGIRVAGVGAPSTLTALSAWITKQANKLSKQARARSELIKTARGLLKTPGAPASGQRDRRVVTSKLAADLGMTGSAPLMPGSSGTADRNKILMQIEQQLQAQEPNPLGLPPPPPNPLAQSAALPPGPPSNMPSSLGAGGMAAQGASAPPPSPPATAPSSSPASQPPSPPQPPGSADPTKQAALKRWLQKRGAGLMGVMSPKPAGGSRDPNWPLGVEEAAGQANELDHAYGGPNEMANEVGRINNATLLDEHAHDPHAMPEQRLGAPAPYPAPPVGLPPLVLPTAPQPAGLDPTKIARAKLAGVFKLAAEPGVMPQKPVTTPKPQAAQPPITPAKPPMPAQPPKAPTAAQPPMPAEPAQPPQAAGTAPPAAAGAGSPAGAPASGALPAPPVSMPEGWPNKFTLGMTDMMKGFNKMSPEEQAGWATHPNFQSYAKDPQMQAVFNGWGSASPEQKALAYKTWNTKPKPVAPQAGPPKAGPVMPAEGFRRGNDGLRMPGDKALPPGFKFAPGTEGWWNIYHDRTSTPDVRAKAARWLGTDKVPGFEGMAL